MHLPRTCHLVSATLAHRGSSALSPHENNPTEARAPCNAVLPHYLPRQHAISTGMRTGVFPDVLSPALRVHPAWGAWPLFGFPPGVNVTGVDCTMSAPGRGVGRTRALFGS